MPYQSTPKGPREHNPLSWWEEQNESVNFSCQLEKSGEGEKPTPPHPKKKKNFPIAGICLFIEQKKSVSSEKGSYFSPPTVCLL